MSKEKLKDMREIKFRAFENEKMHYFYLSDTIAPNMEMKVMQFTGMKDKNGKEIYENMILNKKFVIKYLKHRYVLFYISNMSKFEEIFNYENELEITGEYSEI